VNTVNWAYVRPNQAPWAAHENACVRSWVSLSCPLTCTGRTKEVINRLERLSPNLRRQQAKSRSAAICRSILICVVGKLSTQYGGREGGREGGKEEVREKVREKDREKGREKLRLMWSVPSYFNPRMLYNI